MRPEDKLLKATEEVFTEVGYAATSVRSITKKAGLNVASVNYYFGNKENLFREMLKARIGPINEYRLKTLKEELKKRGNKAIPLETLFSILLHPLGEVLSKNGKLDLSLLSFIGRFITEPSSFIKELHQDFFKELKTAFGAEIAKNLPHENANELGWKFYISATTMMGTITQYQSYKKWEKDLSVPESVENFMDRIIVYICAGLRADLNEKEWKNDLPEYNI